jgi:predicted kinase
MRFGNDDVRRLMYGNVTTLGPAPVVQAAAESMIAARLGQRLAISALDRTHTTRAARERSLELARANKSTCVALLSRVPLAVVLTRNAARTVVVPESVLATMYDALCDVTPETLLAEGFDTVFTFDDHTDRLVVQLRT